MRFISPKTDFAFKKIFGSAGSQGILRSFLNAVLYEGLPRIASLEIVDPYSIPRLEGMKDSYLDVRAVLDDGQHVIIEMQVLNVPGMEKRRISSCSPSWRGRSSAASSWRRKTNSSPTPKGMWSSFSWNCPNFTASWRTCAA